MVLKNIMEQSFQPMQGGFDYEFLSPLDGKHECPICLMALRQPVQTSCGHRFCNLCIRSWLSDSSNECPIDKSNLANSDIFFDHFVEREVLNLKVRCSNVKLGCNWQADLKYIDDHVQACMFKPVMCPNECSATILQNELDEHLSNQCIHRLVYCVHCGKSYTFSKAQIHMTSCPSIKIACELCGKEITRKDISIHLSETCQKACINCMFVEYGCQTNAKREDMGSHLQNSTDIHLQLLLSAFKRMNTIIQELHRNVPFSRQASLKNDISTIVAEASGTSFLFDNTIEYQIDEEPDHTAGLEEFRAEKVEWDISSESEAAQSYTLEAKTKSSPIALNKSDKRSFKGVNSIESMMSDLSNKTVDLDQMVMENMIKLKRLQGEINLSIRRSRKELDSKSCCGNFVWRIPNFLEFCNTSANGSSLLYSSSFYSSCFGYRFRLRMKIYDNSEGSYLSLHIQVMQGDNDDFLDWPFTGNIILSILDCSDERPKSHITEEMNISEALQAFERPKPDRVSKDYGFREFIPVHKLMSEYGDYLKSKCLYVRAVVKYINYLDL